MRNRRSFLDKLLHFTGTSQDQRAPWAWGTDVNSAGVISSSGGRYWQSTVHRAIKTYD
jgi:hypothetical protein